MLPNAPAHTLRRGTWKCCSGFCRGCRRKSGRFGSAFRPCGMPGACRSSPGRRPVGERGRFWSESPTIRPTIRPDLSLSSVANRPAGGCGQRKVGEIPLSAEKPFEIRKIGTNGLRLWVAPVILAHHTLFLPPPEIVKISIVVECILVIRRPFGEISLMKAGFLRMLCMV